jgi:tetratricopeptide (TPR) repeat protein
MTGGYRWFLLLFICCFAVAGRLFAQDEAPAQVTATPPSAITDDVKRLLELGELYMGINNPEYARRVIKSDPATRDVAGSQALCVFQQVTTLAPDNQDGWLWLGIAYTERLHYTKQTPQGIATHTRADITAGMDAFRMALRCQPTDLLCATYYGDALMTYCQNFDAAREFWDNYLTIAKTDMQRVIAMTQAARACLNKAYFGKQRKTLSADEAKEQYATAERYVQQAAAIMPRMRAVQTMQALLLQYHDACCSK